MEGEIHSHHPSPTLECLENECSYPNVPLTVLQRKGTDGAAVHVANPKSHNCKQPLPETQLMNKNNRRL